jgi:hypothetical protein
LYYGTFPVEGGRLSEVVYDVESLFDVFWRDVIGEGIRERRLTVV